MQKSALEAQSRRFSIFSHGVGKSLKLIRQKSLIKGVLLHRSKQR